MAETKAPPRESYRFVLRKVPPHPPEIAERVSGYDEAQETYDITHPDGVRRRTLFLNSQYFRDRLWKMGCWEDVTHLWPLKVQGVQSASSPATVVDNGKSSPVVEKTDKSKPVIRQGRAPIRIEG